VRLSLLTAGLAAFVAGLVGTCAALVFSRRSDRSVRAVDLLGRLPVMLPPLFIGAGAVTVVSVLDLTPGVLTIVIGQTALAVPFVILIVLARLRTVDPELELAARDLGSGPWEAFRRITLPNIAPAIIGAMLLSFAWSFDEVLLTSFTSGPLSTVPIYLLGIFRRFVDPSVNALATVMLLVPWVCLAVGALALRRSGTRATDVLGGEN